MHMKIVTTAKRVRKALVGLAGLLSLALANGLIHDPEIATGATMILIVLGTFGIYYVPNDQQEVKG
jgi:hypothetical protein